MQVPGIFGDKKIDDGCKGDADCKERMRAIAYSTDLLIPGIYFWWGKLVLRMGGVKPSDKPYRYPGIIHSKRGLAIVLPGCFIWSSYKGTYDPRHTSN